MAASVLGLIPMLAGCSVGQPRTDATMALVAEAAAPILALDPDAVWTASYQRLCANMPASLAWLAEHPRLAEPVAPDDLQALVHLSLFRALIYPPQRPPLVTTCLSTQAGLLYFDLRVAGREVGPTVLAGREPPRTWHELFPAEVDQRLVGLVDVEADRQVALAWWQLNRDRLHMVAPAPALRPKPAELYRLLSLRPANQWYYQPIERRQRCSFEETPPALFRCRTYDYNVVRAACLWLGSASDEAIRQALVELALSGSPVQRYNVLFALQHDPDPRIQALLRRYKGEADETESRESCAPGINALIADQNLLPSTSLVAMECVQ